MGSPFRPVIPVSLASFDAREDDVQIRLTFPNSNFKLQVYCVCAVGFMLFFKWNHEYSSVWSDLIFLNEFLVLIRSNLMHDFPPFCLPCIYCTFKSELPARDRLMASKLERPFGRHRVEFPSFNRICHLLGKIRLGGGRKTESRSHRPQNIRTRSAWLLDPQKSTSLFRTLLRRGGQTTVDKEMEIEPGPSLTRLAPTPPPPPRQASDTCWITVLWAVKEPAKEAE